MRDYDFGNRLAELRKAHGYSQFQLGTLVGVSDKAVSKWENGAAKPRVAVIMKLAAILGVEMEEILMDSRENIKDGNELAKKKRDLWIKAEERLKELYGSCPDLRIRNRFLMEKNALGSSDVIMLLDTMSQLREYANSLYAIFSARGMTACSLVAWLLGASEINPLPAHYRCPSCGKVVFRPDYKCGWDMPEKTCDGCGCDMIRDGHDLPFELCACGSNSALVSMECNLEHSLIKQGWKMALELLFPFYSFKRQECTQLGDFEERATRIYLLPKKGEAIEELDRISILTEDEYHEYLGNVPSLLLLPIDGRKNRGSEFPQNMVRSDLLTKSLRFHIEEQRKEYEKLTRNMDRDEDFSIILKHLPGTAEEVSTFTKLVDILCAADGTYTVERPEEMAEVLGLDDYLKLPFSREDVWHMIRECSGLGDQVTGIASEIVYKIRRGKYVKNLSEDDRKLFEQLNLPDWFAAFAQRVEYLFPRSHVISYAHQLLMRC